MPVILLERLPLPNLKTYTCVSVLALSACFYYATYVVKDPEWSLRPKNGFEVIKLPKINNDTSVDSRTFKQFTGEAFSVLIKEPLCVWLKLSIKLIAFIVIYGFIVVVYMVVIEVENETCPAVNEVKCPCLVLDTETNTWQLKILTDITFPKELPQNNTWSEYLTHILNPLWEISRDALITLIHPQEVTELVRGSFMQKLVHFVVKIGQSAEFALKPEETMINMAYCCLILLGRCVQRLVFGQLRVSEQQHLEEKFWNFVFYKFIFVFGVINVQYLEEVLLWCSWFSFVGFLHLLSQLGKDRFEYLSFSPTTPAWNHVKLLGLLGCIFALSLFMLLVCIFIGFFQGLNTFAFMSIEVVLLMLRTLHVIVRYVLHLYDVCREGSGSPNRDNTSVWEKRGPIVYYIELVFELAALFIDFGHHMHMLVWSNIFLSMASLVICMQLRYLFHEIQRICKKHRNYLWVLKHMEQNYPMASAEELSTNSDNCAICWEKMESARKLPCTHLFHTMCLQSWLEQDKSCPTCRLTLNIENPSDARLETPEIPHNVPQTVRRPINHFFHFDGSRYVSWLPSFSVEVSQLPSFGHTQPASNSQLDAMARQVLQLFPHFSFATVIEDLRITRAVELTIENILEGRLSAPVFREIEGRATAAANNSTGSLFQNSIEPSSSTQNWDDLPVDTTECDDTATVGSRFSKSPTERENMLYKRKERLIQNARKRYIERLKSRSDS